MKNRSALIIDIEDYRLRNKNNIYMAIIDISGLQKINKLKGFKRADNIIINVANTIIEGAFKNSQSYSLYGGKFVVSATANRQEEFSQKINTLIKTHIKCQ